jgi:hypothetical protein
VTIVRPRQNAVGQAKQCVYAGQPGEFARHIDHLVTITSRQGRQRRIRASIEQEGAAARIASAIAVSSVSTLRRVNEIQFAAKAKTNVILSELTLAIRSRSSASHPILMGHLLLAL